MEKIYIIENNDSFNKKLKYNKISFSTKGGKIEDADLHEYISKVFLQYRDIKKIIIPLTINKNYYLGLKLALHIRLNQQIEDKIFIPILLYSNSNSLDSIYFATSNQQEQHSAYILNTPGVDFVDDWNDITPVINALQPITKNEYLQVLNSLKIEGVEGKHSLANFWGALRLDKIVSGGKILKTNKIIANKQKDLYFKYLRAFHYFNNKQYNISENKNIDVIESSDKKILLIDDEHNKGWSDVLEKVFKNGDFQFVNHDNLSSQDFINKAKKTALNKAWDLILLDLRLNPTEEDDNNYITEPKTFSGTKLLNEIKDNNSGTQIIIFTASNKAWNMQELINLGADGYYIKEAPEFNFTDKITKNHYNKFKKNVSDCFKKDFLRNHFDYKKNINNYVNEKIESTTNDAFINFLKNLNNQFALAFESSLNINFEKKSSIDIAFIMYFQCFEIIQRYHNKKNYNLNKQIVKYFSITDNNILEQIKNFISIRKDVIHKNINNDDFKKEHFTTDELKDIVEVIYKLVFNNLKEITTNQ